MGQNLKDKVIVITGVSSGFGKGAALKFAESGAHLVLAARRDQLLDELASECQTKGVRAIAVPTDVSQSAEVENLAARALAEFGRIDVWVNDAGVGALGRFEEIPLADHLQVLQTNLGGVVSGSYFAMKQFRKQGNGVLINIASGLGKIPAPYYSSYTASKYDIVGLDGTLRQELEENNLKDIHVCTIMPMAMDTPFFDHAANYTGHESQPIPPLYDPQMVVDAIVKTAVEPEAEVMVGGAGVVMGTLHNAIPAVVQKIMGKETHMTQMEKAPPAEDTAGSVHEPVAEGTEVSAGRLG